MKAHRTGTAIIWWELLVPVVLWACYVGGLLGSPNPVFLMMRRLAKLAVPMILVLGAGLLILPGLAAGTALVRFNQARRHSHSREGNLRLFVAGMLGAVMMIWGIMLFVAPGR